MVWLCDGDSGVESEVMMINFCMVSEADGDGRAGARVVELRSAKVVVLPINRKNISTGSVAKFARRQRRRVTVEAVFVRRVGLFLRVDRPSL
jgi:hypothetical protein